MEKHDKIEKNPKKPRNSLIFFFLATALMMIYTIEYRK